MYKDGYLYISFERVNRVDIYTRDGIKVKKLKLNKRLNEKGSFKIKNKGLESLAFSKKLGFITAPEIPFENKNTHILYAKENTYAIAQDGYISALEFVDDTRLLVLEREYMKTPKRYIVTLSMVDLGLCASDRCKKNTLKVFDSRKDGFVDNYEGLTKLDKNLFLMVSDDQQNDFQKTLFMLFEIN